MAKPRKPNPLTPFLAGMLAWIIPGAGHVYLGRTVRGVIICVCVNGLFWTGMALGGVFTVDPVGERWWFIAQISSGVSGAAGWYHQDQKRHALRDELKEKMGTDELRPDLLEEREGTYAPKHIYNARLRQDNIALVYPADVVSRAYTGVAGMLNMMCIFDAVLLALMGRFGEPPPEPAKAAAKDKAKEAPR